MAPKGIGSFDPEHRGPTGYRSKKRRVIPSRRHWYRGWWLNYNPRNVLTVTIDRDLVDNARDRTEHMRRMLGAGL